MNSSSPHHYTQNLRMKVKKQFENKTFIPLKLFWVKSQFLFRAKNYPHRKISNRLQFFSFLRISLTLKKFLSSWSVCDRSRHSKERYLKMLRLSSFLCCMSLELGAKFIGWFHFLLSLLSVIYFTFIGFSLITHGKKSVQWHKN